MFVITENNMKRPVLSVETAEVTFSDVGSKICPMWQKDMKLQN